MTEGGNDSQESLNLSEQHPVPDPKTTGSHKKKDGEGGKIQNKTDPSKTNRSNYDANSIQTLREGQ